jgi:hypothetical protein
MKENKTNQKEAVKPKRPSERTIRHKMRVNKDRILFLYEVEHIIELVRNIAVDWRINEEISEDMALAVWQALKILEIGLLEQVRLDKQNIPPLPKDSQERLMKKLNALENKKLEEGNKNDTAHAQKITGTTSV